MQYERDLTTVSNYDAVKDLPPGERGLSIFDTSPRNWAETVGSGATPGGRMAVPYMYLGAGAERRAK
jgi:hypothetical protein